jgi:hypothetical protein
MSTTTTKPPCSNSGCEKVSTKKCSGCEEVGYCSQQCQKLNWPDHKAACKVSEKKTKKETKSPISSIVPPPPSIASTSPPPNINAMQFRQYVMDKEYDNVLKFISTHSNEMPNAK